MTRIGEAISIAIMAALAVFFQSIPILLGDGFILLTLLSALPIYIVSRVSPKSGFISYFISSAIITIFSKYQGAFFIFANGALGLTMGICRYKYNRKLYIIPITSVILTLSLSVLNYLIGIPVFGSKIPGSLPFQIFILFVFTVGYSVIFLYFGNSVCRKMSKTRLFYKKKCT